MYILCYYLLYQMFIIPANNMVNEIQYITVERKEGSFEKEVTSVSLY